MPTRKRNEVNCTDFREKYQRYLDSRGRDEFQGDLHPHLGLCPGCRSYVSEVRGIDLALRAMPEVEMSPQLLATLRELPDSLREPQVKGYIVRYAALILVAFLGWMLAGSVSHEMQLLTHGLILAAGAFAFTVGLLKPHYFNPVPDT